MTLKDIIDVKRNKYIEIHQRINTSTDFWQGYAAGLEAAYQDLEEILKQKGFDMNIVVFKKR